MLTEEIVGSKILIDDTWLCTFHFLNVQDFFSIRVTCKHFRKITDHEKNGSINRYWEYKCKLLCENVSSSFCAKYKTQNWFLFYKQFILFILYCYSQKYTRKSFEIQYTDKQKRKLSLLESRYSPLLTYRRMFCRFTGSHGWKRRLNTLWTWNSEFIIIFDDSNDDKCFSPIFAACIKDHLLILQLFLFTIHNENINGSKDNDDIDLNKGYKYNGKKYSMLFMACDAGSLNIVKYLLGFYLIYNEKFQVYIGNYKQQLPFSNINLGIQDPLQGDTPLTIACHRSNLEIVKLLINHPNMTKDILNMKNYEGYTGLQTACWKGDYDIVALFLNDKRIDVNHAN